MNVRELVHGLRGLRKIGRFAAAILTLVVIAPRYAESSIQAYHRAYGPKSAILVSCPMLQWEVWPSEGAKVTASSMLINGEPVRAVYSESHRRLEYRPDRPLIAGTYKVQCKVTVSDRLDVKKEWSFQVSNGARDSLSEPIPDQDKALEIANQYRRELKLPNLIQEPRLNAAALAHVKYLALNHRIGHYEKEGEPGFVGVTPSDRLEAFGYSGGSWECVTYNSGQIPESVRDLFHAPYHRIPFLQPGSAPAGTGFAGKSFSIKFGDSGEGGFSCSPCADQTGIPLSWDGNETPNPLRIHSDVPSMVGYPIVFSYFSSDQSTLEFVQGSITRDGETIPVYINHRENDDHLDNSIILIPKKPLVPSTMYTVRIEAKVNGKKTLSREWSFTTGLK